MKEYTKLVSIIPGRKNCIARHELKKDKTPQNLLQAVNNIEGTSVVTGTVENNVKRDPDDIESYQLNVSAPIDVDAMTSGSLELN